MKTTLLSICMLVLAGCATKPDWHWDKAGAYQSDINADMGQCRAQALSGTGGYVTQGTVMIMYSCMEGKGYQRVPNAK